ncbi:MAG: signal peptidase I [Clostridia bacterium]|nr:signal peptidase I [Clostridia bacterium]
MAKYTLYQKNEREIRSNIVFGIVASVVLFLLAAAVIFNNLLFVKVYVNGSSMYPTLKSGDIVSLSVFRTPNYGDIVVISGEKENGDWLIKRAIAFGGDSVKIENGKVFLKKTGETDFSELEEPYLNGRAITFYPNVNNRDNVAPFVISVEKDCVFYLGDNRMNSKDSRSEFGSCKKEQIVGVVSEFSLNFRGFNAFWEKISAPIKNFFGISTQV